MVGCAHLGRAVRISSVDAPQLKQPEDSKARLPKDKGCDQTESLWNCVVCGTSESPWVCLSCGLVHCGRYVNGDGQRHFDDDDDHALSMDCFNYTVFCYKCDDYVVGDTMDRKIFGVRSSLQFQNSARFKALELADSVIDEGTEEEDAERNLSSTTSRRSNHNEEDSSSVPEDSPPGGRRLRKRKHSPSSDTSKTSNGVEEGPWKGLRNLGNTCYMNSVIQALNSLEIFRDFMDSLSVLEYEGLKSGDSSSAVSPRYKTRRYTQTVSSDHSEVHSSSTMLAEELRKTMKAISPNGSSTAFSPHSLLDAVWGMCSRFSGHSQQDCHEFLRYTLDQVHADLRRCRIPDSCAWKVANRCAAEDSPTSSAVSLMFEGVLQSQVTCMSCQMTSNKQDPFLDLSLDIHPLPNTRSATIPLDECIQSFFGKEELEDCEQYMCGSCEDRKPSTKQLFLRGMPKILCLHLKRFRWSHSSRAKVDNMVEFPLRGLDMSRYLSPNVKMRGKGCVYDLSSIVVHHGAGMGGGHYTAYGLRDGQWAHYNDSSVKAVNSEAILKQKAYLLFYTRIH